MTAALIIDTYVADVLRAKLLRPRFSVHLEDGSIAARDNDAGMAIFQAASEMEAGDEAIVYVRDGNAREVTETRLRIVHTSEGDVIDEEVMGVVAWCDACLAPVGHVVADCKEAAE